MTEIRPGFSPPSTPAAQTQRPASEGARALFEALVQRRAFAAPGAVVSATPPAVEPETTAPSQSAQPVAATSKEPQKILRPGSIIDIRV